MFIDGFIVIIIAYSMWGGVEVSGFVFVCIGVDGGMSGLIVDVGVLMF